MTASQTKRTRKSPEETREQILRSAYRLFSSQGVAQVGIDTILADSGCAKASLYNNFPSKEALALAFLERREQEWTYGWLEEEVRRRSSDPKERLLAVFDVFGEWFKRRNFEGCPFVNILLESEFNSPIHRAATGHLANIRALLRGFAIDAGLQESDRFVQAWHILMKGSIVAACEGNRNAATEALAVAEIVLENWPKTPEVPNHS
ncbi:MAG TPA: TetR/AcrR family transcriptional regulator [Rhizobium sp.]